MRWFLVLLLPFPELDDPVPLSVGFEQGVDNGIF